MNQDRIALKPYLEQIKEFCQPLAKEELTDVLVSLAKDVSTSERAGFIEKIKSILPDRGPAEIPDTSAIDQVLNKIQALRESIEERIESIEDGSYWDDPDIWEDSGYDDEDPEYVDDDQIEDVAAFFSEAEDLFMGGWLEDAGRLYASLFDMVDYIEEKTYFSSSEEFDIREARANFSRCIYETCKPGERLDAFAEAMAVYASDPYEENNLYDEKYPLLQDVIDARESRIEGLEAFLSDWKKFLARNDMAARPAFLLLEAVHLTDGIEGVSRLARQWKSKQPRGYLFWLDLLKKENKQAEIIRISKEGLDSLENGSFRERVAQFLIDAAVELDNRDQLLFGKRERFTSNRNDQNLLDLVAEAARQNRRDEEIAEILKFFENSGTAHEKGALYIKVLLMAGKLEEAVLEAKKEKGLGWSYGKAGVVFGAVLWSLSKSSGKIPTIDKLFRNYANQIDSYSGRFSIDDEKTSTFFEEITKGLQERKGVASQAAECLSWAEKIGNNRIDGIVSNKHRKAYGRAAQVLGSLAEAYISMGNEKKALKILSYYYHEKYNRFSAFRREVQSVVAGSSVLQQCGFL